MIDKRSENLPTQWSRHNPIRVEDSIILLKFHLSKKIKNFYDESGLTQKEIAIEMGVTQPKFNKVINKKFYEKISIELMIKMLLSANIPIKIIFENSKQISRAYDRK